MNQFQDIGSTELLRARIVNEVKTCSQAFEHSTIADAHTRTYTHPYECTHAHSTPMSTSEILSRHSILRLTKSSQAPRSWRERLLPLNKYRRKTWSKFKKMQAPVPSLGLQPWWAGSTIRNLTIWAMLSSLTCSQMIGSLCSSCWGVTGIDVQTWWHSRLEHLAGLWLQDAPYFVAYQLAADCTSIPE
jgi:hypothetical protein